MCDEIWWRINEKQKCTVNGRGHSNWTYIDYTNFILYALDASYILFSHENLSILLMTTNLAMTHFNFLTLMLCIMVHRFMTKISLFFATPQHNCLKMFTKIILCQIAALNSHILFLFHYCLISLAPCIHMLNVMSALGTCFI